MTLAERQRVASTRPEQDWSLLKWAMIPVLWLRVLVVP